MEGVQLLGRVVDETTKVVDRIEPGELGAETPCVEWSVRDLMNHITGGATMFALSAEQGAVPDDVMGELMGGDNLGEDYKGSWAIASRRAMDAFGRPGVLEQTVTLPFGTMPAGVALDIAAFDVATHAVDLARATGQPAPADDVLQAALAKGQAMIGPDFRQPGLFDAEQPIADDAPLADRLLAFAGRKI